MYLTIKGDKILDVLKSEVHLAPAVSNPDQTKPSAIAWTKAVAIWDTGATACCISNDMALKIGLPQIGTTMVSTANGVTTQPIYAAAFGLIGDHDAVSLPFIQITGMPALASADMLIGMDIITLGDFSITNRDKATWLSFRVPSESRTDYGSHSNAKPKKKKK